MKLKVNLAGPKPVQKPEEQEGWLSYLNRNIVTPAARGIATRVAGSLPRQDYGLEAVRQFNPQLAKAVEAQGPMGLASQQAPHPIIGTAAQLAPGFVQAGGLAGVKRAGELAKTTIGGLLGGETAAAGARALGLGEKGQQAFAIGGSLLGGTVGRHAGLRRPSTVLAEKAFEHAKTERPKEIHKLKTDQERLYKVVENRTKDYKFPAQDLRSSMRRLQEQSLIGVDEIDAKKINNTINQVEELISNNTMKVGDAIKFVQNRNKAVYDQNMTPIVKQYNKQIISDLNDFIDRAGKRDPLLGRAYDKAKQTTIDLHELKDQQKRFENMSFKDYQKDLTKKTIEEYLSEGVKLASKQILPSTLSAIAYYFGGGKAAGVVSGTLFAGKQLKQEIQNVRAILKENPGLKKDLEALGKAALEQDKPLFDGILTRINDRFSKEDKKKKPVAKGKIKFR